MATLCRLDVFLLFTFLNIISNSRSYINPAFLTFLKFVIGHIARYAPSSKLRNQQKYRSKLANLFFHHYLVTEKFVHLHHKASASRRQVLHGSYKQQVVYDRTKSN